MYCIGCNYDLRASPHRACPECGHVFDPGDPKTYLEAPASGPERVLRSRVWSRRVWVACWVFSGGMPAMLYMTWFVAWLALGHRPRPSLDDPKYINLWVDVCYHATMLMMIVFPGVLLFSVYAAVWDSIARRRVYWQTALWVLLMVAWAAGLFALLQWDPLRVGEWFMD